MNKVIIFRLGPSEWALPAEMVHQVLAPRPVTRLPDPPPLVCGLVAWRAKVLPVLALYVAWLRQLEPLPPPEPAPEDASPAT